MSNAQNDCYERLVAYVDGQLSRDEREYMLALLEQDPELNRCAWELRRIKDMVEFAYESVAVPPDLSNPPRPHWPHRFLTTWVALLLLLTVGLLGYAVLASRPGSQGGVDLQARNDHTLVLPAKPDPPGA